MTDTNPGDLFDVVCTGVLPGFNHADARAGLAGLFKITDEQAEKILSRGRTTIKSGVDRALGEKYLQRLSAIGVAATLVPVAQQAPSAHPAAVESGSGEARSDGEGTGAGGNTAASAGPRQVPFIFSGNGFEYFKIWIVNILLSIVTLGIYSAWAKVRNNRYFYGNTTLDGASFSYTADPVKILIGRVIAFVFLLLYTFAGEFSIVAGFVMGLLLLVFIPWVVCKSLRFNARYSQYRNVPFVFHGRVGQAAMAYLLWPFLALITLGILIPYAYYEQRRFIYGNHAYGTARFDFRATVGGYYVIFLLMLAIFVVGAVLLGINVFLLPVLNIPLLMLLYLGAFAYFTVATSNLNYNSLHIREHRFQADWKTPSYLWLLFTNTLGIVVTLGLFIPWARVRTARYKAEHTRVLAVGDLDAFAADEREAVNSVGEGVGDLFDIEVGF